MADNISVRDSLQAAHDELSADLGADPTPANVADDGSSRAQAAPAGETPAAEAASGEAAPIDQAAADAARDEKGRFKAKTDTPAAEGAQAAVPLAAPVSETATPAGQEPQPEAIRVPPSLPAAIKAKFASLDPDVREAFVALEGSVQTAKAEWGKKGERLNRFDEIIGPRLPRWQMAGVDEFQGIQMLLAAQDILDRDPVQGLVQVARSYGVTPAHLAQAFGLQVNGQTPGAEGQQAPTGAPDIQAVLQSALSPVLTQVQTLTQRLDQTAQQSQAAEVTRLANQIQEFAAKPENMYFDNVSDEVVLRARQLAGDGPVTMDMVAKAYESAIWADPSIRPHLLKSSADAEAKETARKADEARKATEQAARDKARSAGHASGSVTGSPAPGSGAPKVAYGSVREAALAAIEELNGA